MVMNGHGMPFNQILHSENMSDIKSVVGLYELLDDCSFSVEIKNSKKLKQGSVMKIKEKSSINKLEEVAVIEKQS